MKTYLEPAEIMLLEQTCTNFRDRLLIRLLFRLGCRITEALSAIVEDVDFSQRTITIIHLKHRIKLLCPECSAKLGTSHIYCSKCGKRIENTNAQQFENRRRRVLPIDQGTLNILREYIDCGGPIVKNGKQLLFGINRHRAWQIVKQCAEKAGLPKLMNPETGKVHNISPHKLRDAFAVNAVKHDDSGDGLRLLQEHLGHQSFNTTAKYRKVAGEEHKAWYDRLWRQRDENPEV
ncbi:tyrosine-type recombinase/integrase [bacterium]|nr:tyrosine-type recombinase/integrase [bacterium]